MTAQTTGATEAALMVSQELAEQPGAEPPAPPARASRRSHAGMVAGAAALAAALVVLAAGALAPPLHETYAPTITPAVGAETVYAAMERGLSPLHPLILDAYVEPGSADQPTELGHRATVTFTMLGIPGPTTVRLFVDVGAHWGGVPDRGAAELATWSLVAPLLVAGAILLGWRVLGRRG
jgi:hypothetical protein